MGLGRLEAAAPQEQADGGGSGRRWRHSGDGRRERMGRRASGGQWGSVSGVGLGRGGLEKGAPRRAELGSHGNGGWGALGARRGPAWAFIGAWVSLGAGFLRLGGNAGLGECGTGAARPGGQRWPAMASWQAQEGWGRVSSSGAAREGRFQANQGRGAGFGRRRDAWAARWPAPAYGCRRRRGSGRSRGRI